MILSQQRPPQDQASVAAARANAGANASPDPPLCKGLLPYLVLPLGDSDSDDNHNSNSMGERKRNHDEQQHVVYEPSAKKSRLSSQPRKETKDSSSLSLPHRVPTDTQTDIQKIVRALVAYSNGTTNHQSYTTTTSNNSNNTTIPTPLKPIPRVLVGLIGSHCEADPEGVAEAARGIVAVCGSKSRQHQRTILRREFRSVFGSGGIEIVLSALQRITPSALSSDSHYNTASIDIESASRKEAIGHCWQVVGTGIRLGGLSNATLGNVLNECLFCLNHSIDLEHPTTCQAHSKILRAVASVLSETIARPELTIPRSIYEAVVTTCLEQLARACATAGNSHAVLQVIGETLSVFVACARKGWIAGSEFQRLVPACRASLARLELELAEGFVGSNGSSTILVRIVELMEAEDKTVGLWLRHTYGIPCHEQKHEPPTESGSNNNDRGAPPPPPANPPRRLPPVVPSWPSVLVAEPDDDETSDEDDDEDDDHC